MCVASEVTKLGVYSQSSESCNSEREESILNRGKASKQAMKLGS